MRTHIFLVLSLIFLQQNLSFGQFGAGIPKSIINDGKFALLVGYNYNRNHFGELGIVRGWRCNYDSPCEEMIAGPLFYYYSSFSSEFIIDKSFIICPKLGYHFVFGFIGVGISVLDYTDFNKHNFGIRPEVGWSLGGIIGGYYGYNLTLNETLFNVTTHNIGIKVIVSSGFSIDEKWRQKHDRKK